MFDICRLFKKKKPYIDPDRDKYRAFFNIEDDYLIEYSIEQEVGEKEETGYIVYIDPVNDIDWKDTRTRKDWDEDEQRRLSQCIAKLNEAHAEPTGHLSMKTIRAFKLKLGAGYVLALNRSFDEVDSTIDEALKFVRQRNTEKSRQLFLQYSTLVVASTLILWILNKNASIVCKDLALALLYGTLGSYFSIWTRYGKMVMTGLSAKWLHFLETLTRLIIGAISASVAYLAVKSGVLFTFPSEPASVYLYGLLGFAAGFSERTIPSLMEAFTKQLTKE